MLFAFLILALLVLIIVIIKTRRDSLSANFAQKRSEEINKLDIEIKEWLANSPQFLVVTLPEPNDGRGSCQIAAIKNLTKEEVMEIFKGSRLGVMGSELRDECFSWEPQPVVEEYMRCVPYLNFYDSADHLRYDLAAKKLFYQGDESLPDKNSIFIKQKYLRYRAQSSSEK